MGIDDAEARRADLMAERERVRHLLGDLGESFDDIVLAAKDSNLDDEHDPEGATIAVERSLLSSMSREAADKLIAIEQALARLDEGTYGICLACAGAIAPGRLEARPAAALCIRCAAAQAGR